MSPRMATRHAKMRAPRTDPKALHASVAQKPNRDKSAMNCAPRSLTAGMCFRYCRPLLAPKDLLQPGLEILEGLIEVIAVYR